MCSGWCGWVSLRPDVLPQSNQMGVMSHVQSSQRFCKLILSAVSPALQTNTRVMCGSCPRACWQHLNPPRPPAATACPHFVFSPQVSFNVSVEARSCPPRGADQSFTIKPVGFKDRLQVAVNYQCDCGCSRTAQTNSSICSSIGSSPPRGSNHSRFFMLRFQTGH